MLIGRKVDVRKEAIHNCILTGLLYPKLRNFGDTGQLFSIYKGDCVRLYLKNLSRLFFVGFQKDNDTFVLMVLKEWDYPPSN